MLGQTENWEEWIDLQYSEGRKISGPRCKINLTMEKERCKTFIFMFLKYYDKLALAQLEGQ